MPFQFAETPSESSDVGSGHVLAPNDHDMIRAQGLADCGNEPAPIGMGVELGHVERAAVRGP